MLLSLLVYGLTGAVLYLLGWHVNRREQRLQLQGGKQLPFYSWEIVLSLVVFSVVAGARYHTGYDHAMYLEQYQHLQQTGEFSRHNFEYGFEWISKCFAWCNIHYFFYFAFWALLQIGFLYYGLRNHKHLLCWVGLGIMCGPFFLSWMNSVRQSVVVCLFVSLIPLIKKRKFLIYALIIIVASFLHKSALLLLPVFLITYIIDDKKEVNRYWLLGIFLIFVLLGIFPFWIEYITNYQWFLDLTGYGNYGNLSDPNVGGTLRRVAWGPSRISLLLSNVIMIYFYPSIKSYFKEDELLPYFFVLSFVGMCLSNLLINTTHFILRPLDYFTVFDLLLGAYYMVCFLKTRKIAIAILMSLVLYSHFVIDVFKGVYLPIQTNLPLLYHSFLISI